MTRLIGFLRRFAEQMITMNMIRFPTRANKLDIKAITVPTIVANLLGPVTSNSMIVSSVWLSIYSAFIFIKILS